MPDCKKCGEHFKNIIWIEGKRKDMCGRVYCNNCLAKRMINESQLFCEICGKPVKSQNCYRCHVCWSKDREKTRENILYELVGNACWICGYNKGKYMLDFHHIDPSKKQFCLNKRTIGQLAWARIIDEVQKCALLCCRCHREVTIELIDGEVIYRAYKQKWELIGDINKYKLAFDDKRSPELIKECLFCKKDFVTKHINRKFCSTKCSHKNQRKVERPPIKEIIELLKTNSCVATAKMFGVTDNTIRKWIEIGDVA